ncbi:hypothetical protein [Pseudobacteroides cellulosolvens]|uniref:hypothetical protein n=1 Tax=Pseudobacteroides cellulosolvens TaxID=35825 RepID=UPI00128ED94B|nr:hypothetical protein [Pseudobacteroides cellulosolvens]
MKPLEENAVNTMVSGRNRAIHFGPQQSSNYTAKEIKGYILSLTEGSDIDEKYLSIEEVT